MKIGVFAGGAEGDYVRLEGATAEGRGLVAEKGCAARRGDLEET
jgi:hypothetical protein